MSSRPAKKRARGSQEEKQKELQQKNIDNILQMLATESLSSGFDEPSESDGGRAAQIRSKYVGVFWNSADKRWQAQICGQIKEKGKKRNITKDLGYYFDEKKAAKAYDKEALLLGRPVNFPKRGQKQAKKKAPMRDMKNLKRKDPPRSKYVGVGWRPREQKWHCQIQIGRSKVHLGHFAFEDEERAAREYDKMAIIHGKPLNFPAHAGQEQAMKRAPPGEGPSDAERRRRWVQRRKEKELRIQSQSA